VNGQSSGSLTAYHVQSKDSRDIVSEEATLPNISRDGKRVVYTTVVSGKGHELWVADIDGGNKVKIATAEIMGFGKWAPDSFHLSFMEHKAGIGVGDKAYIVGADGGGLHQLPRTANSIKNINNMVWSPDQKTIYVYGPDSAGSRATWKWSVDGSNPEKLVNSCAEAGVTDADPSGRYLLLVIDVGEKFGIYEVSLSDQKCISLLPGVSTPHAIFARDGKSFLYAVASRGEVTIYRQPWKDGKIIGPPQVGLNVPFAFPLTHANGRGYFFSPDLATIVYAHPGGHADLYLLSQK
jgi:Tol biopolymer transport system component